MHWRNVLFSWNVTKKAYSMLIVHLWCILHILYVPYFIQIHFVHLDLNVISNAIFKTFPNGLGSCGPESCSWKSVTWNFRLVKLDWPESHWLCYYCCLEWGGWAQWKWLSRKARKRVSWLNGFFLLFGEEPDSFCSTQWQALWRSDWAVIVILVLISLIWEECEESPF